jgi:hypothetical protein
MQASRFVIAAGLVCIAGSAGADNKAWKAAQANLPDVPLVIAADLESLTKSSLWAAVAPNLVNKPDVKDAFDAIKSACSIDAMAAVTSMVVAADPANDHTRVVYLAIPGVGKTKAIACLQAMASERAKKRGDKTAAAVTAKTDGNIVALSDGHDTIHIGFIGDVAVIAPDVWSDKDKLKAWMSGGGALGKGGTGKLLARTTTSASVFGASTSADQLNNAQPGAKAAFGWANIAGGKLAAEAHLDFGDAKVAQTNVDDAAKTIAQNAASPPLPGLKPVFAGMSATRSGSELVVKENVAESDVVGLLQLALAFNK